MATLEDVVNAINDLRNSTQAQTPAPASAESRAEREKAAKENLQLIQTQIQANMALAETEEDLRKIENLKVEALRAQQQVTQNLNISEAERQKRLKKYEERIVKSTKALDKATEAQQEHAAAIDSVQDALVTVTGVAKDYSKTLLGQISAIRKNEDAQKKLGEALEKQFTKANIAYSTALKGSQALAAGTVSTFSRIEEGATSFNRASGMADKFGNQINKVAMSMTETGVMSTDVASALSTLSQAFPLKELGSMSAEIAGQFALYEKLGVSAQASAASFTILNRSLGQTEEESLRTLEGVAALGRELGVGPGRLTEEFAQALPRLAIYGNNATKIFGNIATSASKLGLQVDDVINLAEGFQTFEGSAQAAGKLNAILGGGFIDNLELMEASFENPAEAALMIKDAFASAGMSVSSMGPAALKAAAAASGFSDVGKFRSFLEGQIDATEALGDDQLKATLDAKALAKESNTILQNIFNQLRQLSDDILGPILRPIADFAKKFTNASTTGTIGTAATTGTMAQAAGGAGLLAGGKALLTGAGMTASAKAAAKGAGGSMLGAGLIGKANPYIGAVTTGKDLYDAGSDWYNTGFSSMKADDLVPLAGSLIGGTIGGILGGGSTLGVGTIPGALAGAGIGNTAGELVMAGVRAFAPKADTSMANPSATQARQQRELMNQMQAQNGANGTVKVDVTLHEEKDNFKKLARGEVRAEFQPA